MPSENSKRFRRRARQHEALQEQLKDGRGKRVVFVSHCLLNENVRYLGGALRRGRVEEVIMGFLRQGSASARCHVLSNERGVACSSATSSPCMAPKAPYFTRLVRR